jgi:signal peptide peptidase SppA
LAHNYRHVLAAFYGEPLALLPDKARQIAAFLLARSRGDSVPAERVNAIRRAKEERHQRFAAVAGSRRADGTSVVGRVAILPVFGVICQRAGMVEQASGCVSTEAIGNSLDSLTRDPSVKATILLFDSPGGGVAGLVELASRIRAAGQQKPIFALASPTAASAAFWLAAQARELYVEPGGQVGSVGVIAAHEDVSGQQAEAGIKTTLVTSSKYKGEGNPWESLSDEARAELQQKVNAYHQMFVADLAKGRGVSTAKVENNFGQGRMLLDRAAVTAGMADGVMTLSQLIKKLGGTGIGIGSDGGGMGATDLRHSNAMRAAARARAIQVSGEAQQ